MDNSGSEEHLGFQDFGEQPVVPADTLANLPEQRDDAGGQLTFLRRVGDFVDTQGNSFTSGLDEVGVDPHEEPGKFNVFLHSRKGKIIIVTGAALLLAVSGTGVKLQRNRTQRRKMTR